MKKRHVHILIALMALALIGLMGVQFYWIETAYEVRQDQIRLKVQNALRSVVRELEDRESASALTKSYSLNSGGNNEPEIHEETSEPKPRSSFPRFIGSYINPAAKSVLLESSDQVSRQLSIDQVQESTRLGGTSPDLADEIGHVTRDYLASSSDMRRSQNPLLRPDLALPQSQLSKADAYGEVTSTPRRSLFALKPAEDFDESALRQSLESIKEGQRSLQNSQREIERQLKELQAQRDELERESKINVYTFRSTKDNRFQDTDALRWASSQQFPQSTMVVFNPGDSALPRLNVVGVTRHDLSSNDPSGNRMARTVTIHSKSGSKNDAFDSITVVQNPKAPSGKQRKSVTLRPGDQPPDGIGTLLVSIGNEFQLSASKVQVELLKSLEKSYGRQVQLAEVFRKEQQKIQEKLESMLAASPANQGGTPLFSQVYPVGGNTTPLFSADPDNQWQNMPRRPSDQPVFESELALNVVTTSGPKQPANRRTPPRDTARFDEETNIRPVNDGKRQKIAKKAEQFSDVAARLVYEMATTSVPINKRIQEDLIDSLLARQLRRSGLEIDYTFDVVFDPGDSVVLVPARSKNTRETSTEKALRAGLFPNDIKPFPYSLRIRYAKDTSFFLSSLWTMLLYSGLFLATIVGTFWFTVSSLLKQKKLSDLKTEFINNMTHEFQTPIATISLASEALQDGKIADNIDRRTRFLSAIRQENQRLSTQVKLILQAAQVENGRLTFAYAMHDINDLIRTQLDSLAMKLESVAATIHLDLDPKIPVAKLDEVHMRNVVTNLIDNACKYTNTAPVISVQTHALGSSLVIRVSDNGIGMSKEQVKRIFDQFYRVPTGNRHDVKGFGLGLSYVKAIVAAHGGQVSVTSELGIGSTFEVILPIDRGAV